MSESDTMFNERDQRRAAVQLMLSTDPSYDNRTIASTLKMQIRMFQRAQGDENKVSCHGYGLGMVSSEGHSMSPHIFEVCLKVNTKVYLDVLKSVMIPWCNQVAGGRRWVVAAGLGAGPQVHRDPGLASEGVATTWYPSLTGPLLPRPEPAGLLRLVHTLRKSPT